VRRALVDVGTGAVTVGTVVVVGTGAVTVGTVAVGTVVVVGTGAVTVGTVAVVGVASGVSWSPTKSVGSSETATPR